MPINVCWYNDEKTIALFNFVGDWTWGEYGSLFEHPFVGTVPHRVDIIFDFTESAPLPPNALSKFGKYDKTAPANTGYVVIVTTQHFMEVLVHIFNTVYGVMRKERTVWTAPSRDAAVKLLKEKASERIPVQP